MSNILSSFFGTNNAVIQCSSPGRLDVMGGIADYSGALLLQMPIQERTTVSIAKRADHLVHVYSTTAKEAGLPAEVFFSFDESWKEKSNSEMREEILAISGGNWAIYVLGCFILLYKEKEFDFHGADVLIESEVPFGKGVSSSAAIEVATMMAINQAYGLNLGKLELPLLAQKVENHIVGAPCGLMDQLSSYLGEKGKLLPIVCQPVKVFPALSIPEEIRFTGIDSGVKHSVSGIAYSKVRVGAFMGYTIIACALGIDRHTIEEANKSQNWRNLPFGGYLANIPVEEFNSKYLQLLPDKISGEEFLKSYSSTIDSVTSISKQEEYSIRACSAHPVYENERVVKFANLLKQFNSNTRTIDKENILMKLGKLMYASHQSYSSCGLGNEYTDELVQMVEETSFDNGLYGAKITGGGSGGTICVLSYGDHGLESVKKIHKTYQAKYGLTLNFFEGGS